MDGVGAASFFFGARIWLGTILGRFSINYFSGLPLGLRIRVIVWVRVRVRVGVRAKLWLGLVLGLGVRDGGQGGQLPPQFGQFFDMNSGRESTLFGQNTKHV